MNDQWSKASYPAQLLIPEILGNHQDLSRQHHRSQHSAKEKFLPPELSSGKTKGHTGRRSQRTDRA